MYQDDEMGAIMKKGVEDQLATYNMKMAAAESYKRGATDFSSQIAKLKKADVQLVVLATVIRETVGALKEANKLGWKVDMCGMTPAFTKLVPGLCMRAGFSPDGFYCTSQTPMVSEDSPLKTVRDWWQRHKKMFGKDPDQPTIAGYSGIYFFSVAANRAGRDLTREKLVDALETFRNQTEPYFGSAPLTFTSTSHQGGFAVFMARVKGGKFIKISDFIDFRK